MLEATIGDVIDDRLYDLLLEHYPVLRERIDFSPESLVAVIEGRRKPTQPIAQVGPSIYVVRDGDCVFYVGQSNSVTARLDEHLGRSSRGGPLSPSRLGQVIRDNLPGSRSWVVEFWSVVECKRELADVSSRSWQWDKDDAERAMIEARRPCLNTMGNPHGRRLPDQYRRPDELTRRAPPAVYSFDLSRLENVPQGKHGDTGESSERKRSQHSDPLPKTS